MSNQHHARMAASPTTSSEHSFNYVCILLTVAARNNWPIFHFDVENGPGSHLDCPIDEEVYIEPPEGFPCEPGKVLKLNKPMLGTAAAARCWWKLLKSLSASGYKGTNFNHCVYTLRKGDETIVMWVDAADGIATASSESSLRTLESLISKCMEVDWNMQFPPILDVDVKKVSGGYCLSQHALANEILKEQWDGTSMEQAPLPEGYTPSTLGQRSEKPASEYLSIMKRLAELATKTRPDLLYSVVILARYSQNPTVEHWNALTHLIRYLARSRTRTLNLIPTGSGSEALDCYSDATWAGPFMPTNHGFLVRLYECPALWASRRLPEVPMSPSEAEWMALSHSIKQALWIRDLVKSVTGTNFKIRLNCDKDAAGKVLNADTPASRMEEFNHPTIRAGHAFISWISDTDQVANILTQPLSENSHRMLSQKMLGGSIAK